MISKSALAHPRLPPKPPHEHRGGRGRSQSPRWGCQSPDPPRAFGPLCLVFAGERPIVWALRCGKCGPNRLLRLPVEGCRAPLPCAEAGWGEDGAGRVGTVPICTKIRLFCAGGSSWLGLWKSCNSFEGFGERAASGAACGKEAQMLGVFLGTLQLWLEWEGWPDLLLAPASPPGSQRRRGWGFPAEPLPRSISPAAPRRPALIPTPAERRALRSAARFSPRRFKEF